MQINPRVLGSIIIYYCFLFIGLVSEIFISVALFRAQNTFLLILEQSYKLIGYTLSSAIKVSIGILMNMPI